VKPGANTGVNHFFFGDITVKSKKTGLARIIAASGHSAEGLKNAWRTEAAFRQELALYLVLLPAIFLPPFSLTVKMLLFFANTVVLITELVNSAIEAIVDLASPDFHPLAKKAKDIGSAAVLLALLLALAAWIFAIVSLIVN